MTFPYWKYKPVSLKGLAKRPEVATLHPAHRYLWRVHLQGCMRRGTASTITAADFVALISGACYYCGAPPSNLTKLRSGANIAYNGIDRVDNAKPYQRANVVTCCKDCNSMKSDRPAGRFLDQVRKIFHHSALTLGPTPTAD